MNLESLFETRVRLSKYESARDELEAVAAGKKGMSFFLFPSSSVETNDFYSELRQISIELSLSIIINSTNEPDRDPKLRTTNIFVVKPSELWRIPMYSAFKSVFEHYNWNDAAEHLQSKLLGYTDDDVVEWLKFRNFSQIGWGGRTFYLLLSPSQAAGMRSLSKRCMAPETGAQPTLIFFNRKRNPMRTDAAELISEAGVLARVAVREVFFRELFARKIVSEDPDVVTSSLTSEKIIKLNEALTSTFQFLEDGNWK